MTRAECNAPAAKNIDKIIKEKGLKQVYVAEKMGYTPQELSDMLNGRRLIKACDILNFSKTLNATLQEIFAL